MGKSLLALSLLEYADATSQKAILVSDDRVDIGAENGDLHMYAPAELQGKIELWGHGILDVDFVPSAKIELIVDIVKLGERMPESSDFFEELLTRILPRCPIPSTMHAGFEHQRLLLHAAIKTLGK